MDLEFIKKFEAESGYKQKDIGRLYNLSVSLLQKNNTCEGYFYGAQAKKLGLFGAKKDEAQAQKMFDSAASVCLDKKLKMKALRERF